MTLAAIDWLSISINLLLVIFVVVCLLMTLLILMQRPKQEGLGAAFGGGVTDQVFGARTTNVLQRGTVYLGSLFFIISLALAVLIGHQNKGISLAKKEAKAAAALEESAAETPADAEEDKPKSLIEELPGDNAQPETPPVSEGAPDAPEGTPVPEAGSSNEPDATPPTDSTTPAEATPAVEPATPAETTPAVEPAPPAGETPATDGDAAPPAAGSASEGSAGETEKEPDQP